MMYKKILLLILLVVSVALHAQTTDNSFSQREVIYSRKDGMALTLFVTTPKVANQKAIIYLASGGYFSSAKWLNDYSAQSAIYLKRGYTVFIVFHGSQPVYSGLEIINDIRKAVQHVRFHAKDYNIDPNRIGITGTSAGANLSLIMGTSEGKSNNVNATPEEQVSSKVQAVACFYPPTDYLNFGRNNGIVVDENKVLEQHGLQGAFQFYEYNATSRTRERIADRAKILDILRQMSPNQLADKTAAPTLIYHGDSDGLVPHQQATLFIETLQKLQVPSKLLIKKGGNHGWADIENDKPVLADWFDLYLK